MAGEEADPVDEGQGAAFMPPRSEPTLPRMIDRRLFLRGLALSPLVAAPALAAEAPLPDRATVLTPGPDEGDAVAWARKAATSLARGLPQAVATRVTPLGGPDGLTAANRFATVDGDGRSLLVLPGQATQARLIGDSRVHYEPGEWVPICCHWQPAMLVGRGAMRDSRRPLVRVAISTPEASDAAALLALDLLAITAVPVTGLAGHDREQAFLTGAVDAFITTDLARAAVLGATPWLDLHVPGLPRIRSVSAPALQELSIREVPGALQAACAAFAAERLRFALVLPRLTPGDVVAAWRHAASRWVEDSAGTAPQEGLIVGAEAAEAYGTAALPSHLAQVYREWQLRRFASTVPPKSQVRADSAARPVVAPATPPGGTAAVAPAR